MKIICTFVCLLFVSGSSIIGYLRPFRCGQEGPKQRGCGPSGQAGLELGGA